jgi:hypothetical protein
MLGPRRKARRSFRCSLAAGSLVAAILALSACGSSESVTILNTEKIERSIERSTFDQRKQRVHVSCPSGVHQQKGLVFSCIAVGARRNTRFVVTQKDDAGQVHYEAP